MAITPKVNVRPQVFINFRGELRETFVSHLHAALKRIGINAFIDSDEEPGHDLQNLFKRIEESEIALAILSSKYTESQWCLDELVKIMECSTKGEGCKNLWVIPIFYKLDPSIVKGLVGDFGVNLLNLWTKTGGVRDDRIVKWNAALQDARNKTALILNESSEEKAFLAKIVTSVQNALTRSRSLRQSQENPKSQERRGEEIPKPLKFHNRALTNTEAGEQRVKQLEEKLDVQCKDNETRIVAVVGMVGIGKTYLAEKLFFKLKKKIVRHVFVQFESDNCNPDWLQKQIVEGLLKKDYPNLSCGDGNALEVLKDPLAEKKAVLVFDNVTDRKQIEPLLIGNCDWITKGSRIVITTRDKSLTEGLECDYYEVPGLNKRDGLELFRTQLCTTLEGKFMEMSRKFVEFAGGNPLALKAFGEELKEKCKGFREARLETLLSQDSNEKIKVLRDSFENDLDEKQRDAFLDIVCFFRSRDENYVTSLLDSNDPSSVEAWREQVRDLVDKFFIHVSNGRVEIHDLLFTMGRELAETTARKYWLLSLNFADSADALRVEVGRDQVRGIVLDMSKTKELALDNKALVGMSNLRYLKVYDSLCPRHCKAQCQLNLPDGLQFPEDNMVRYLDWINFSREQLPSHFEPKNLIDLRLPYSEITSLWSDAKNLPNLKWVDLSHSRKLTSLSGLSKAPRLFRLNLEGCTSLEGFPEEIKEMKNLVFLNLRGCTSLSSLPKITMDSLKTLVLSGCSKLRTLEVISPHLETLYLNSTAIDVLPPSIDNLHRLIYLNLKDCKKLMTLPDCLGKLKSLQELKFSRCSELKSFPDVNEMTNLRVLLLDETSIAEMPSSIFDLSLLRRLCLSGNDNICSLQFDMGQMFHLKWLELKFCSNLTSLPGLPPNLQCLNAHGCTSLRTVASPLALLMPTEQIHSTFIFTNCYELEQLSKNAIISYVQKKTELMSDDRYNQDFVFKPLIGACFPGCEVPACFNHQALGSVLMMDLPRNWNEGGFIGIALCAVVSFGKYKDQNNSLLVECTCEFTNVSLSQESFIVGGWSEPGDEPRTDESEHIFIGYTTLFNPKKRQHLSSATEISLRFEVTNGGTTEVVQCKVMQCGFSLVYEADENTSWEATLGMKNSKQGLRTSFKTPYGDYPNDDNTPTKAESKRLNSFFGLFTKGAQ